MVGLAASSCFASDFRNRKCIKLYSRHLHAWGLTITVHATSRSVTVHATSCSVCSSFLVWFWCWDHMQPWKLCQCALLFSCFLHFLTDNLSDVYLRSYRNTDHGYISHKVPLWWRDFNFAITNYGAVTWPYLRKKVLSSGLGDAFPHLHVRKGKRIKGARSDGGQLPLLIW